MPRCSVCNKYSLFGFVKGTVKPVHVKCVKKEIVHKSYHSCVCSQTEKRKEENDNESGVMNLLLLSQLLERNEHEEFSHRGDIPFEGKGGEFGGGGANGSWDPSPSEPNSSPPSDNGSDSFSDSSSSSCDSGSSDSGSGGGSD